MLPYYLKNHLISIEEKKDSTIGILTSSAGNTNLEIYYYGNTMKIKKRRTLWMPNLNCLNGIVKQYKRYLKTGKERNQDEGYF